MEEMQPATGGGAFRPRRGVGRRLTTAGLVAGLTLALAACSASDDGADDASGDGSSSEPTAAQSWADDVCSTVGSWTSTIAGARSTLSAPRDLTANEIEATFDEVGSATTTMMSDLDDLGAPDTEAGDEAEARVAVLSEELQKQAQVLHAASGDQPQDVEERLAHVTTVSDAMTAMISETQAAVDDIRALDGGQELEDAFTSTESCQDLPS